MIKDFQFMIFSKILDKDPTFLIYKVPTIESYTATKCKNGAVKKTNIVYKKNNNNVILSTTNTAFSFSEFLKTENVESHRFPDKQTSINTEMWYETFYPQHVRKFLLFSLSSEELAQINKTFLATFRGMHLVNKLQKRNFDFSKIKNAIIKCDSRSVEVIKHATHFEHLELLFDDAPSHCLDLSNFTKLKYLSLECRQTGIVATVKMPKSSSLCTLKLKTFNFLGQNKNIRVFYSNQSKKPNNNLYKSTIEYGKMFYGTGSYEHIHGGNEHIAIHLNVDNSFIYTQSTSQYAIKIASVVPPFLNVALFNNIETIDCCHLKLKCYFDIGKIKAPFHHKLKTLRVSEHQPFVYDVYNKILPKQHIFIPKSYSNFFNIKKHYEICDFDVEKILNVEKVIII